MYVINTRHEMASSSGQQMHCIYTSSVHGKQDETSLHNKSFHGLGLDSGLQNSSLASWQLVIEGPSKHPGFHGPSLAIWEPPWQRLAAAT